MSIPSINLPKTGMLRVGQGIMHNNASPYINAISDAQFEIRLYETALQYGEGTIMYHVPLCPDRLYRRLNT